jgi:hypothetical protein
MGGPSVGHWGCEVISFDPFGSSHTPVQNVIACLCMHSLNHYLLGCDRAQLMQVPCL